MVIIWPKKETINFYLKGTAMNKDYQIISKKNSKELAKFLSKEGQFLLPMLELIEQAEAAVDEVIDVVGRASIEAILLLSAQQVAAAQHKGKNTGDICWLARQTERCCTPGRAQT